IARHRAGTTGLPDAAPVWLASAGSDIDDGDHVLADYVTPAGDRGARSGSRSRWPRALVAAAAIVAVVGIGVALVGGDDDGETLGPAQGSTTAPAPAARPAVAVLPTTPPDGQALIWLGTFENEEGEAVMLRYSGEPGREPLAVTSVVVGPNGSVPETGESGSVELWGDREVAVSEDGRKAQFVDPSGVYVQVTGEPVDVEALVPALAPVDGQAWEGFVDGMSADIRAMPV